MRFLQISTLGFLTMSWSALSGLWLVLRSVLVGWFVFLRWLCKVVNIKNCVVFCGVRVLLVKLSCRK